MNEADWLRQLTEQQKVQEIQVLRRELVTLRVDLEARRDALKASHENLLDTHADAVEERDALRAALKRIAFGPMNELMNAGAIAREALANPDGAEE